jgi:hypothetical protein
VCSVRPVLFERRIVEILLRVRRLRTTAVGKKSLETFLSGRREIRTVGREG